MFSRIKLLSFLKCKQMIPTGSLRHQYWVTIMSSKLQKNRKEKHKLNCRKHRDLRDSVNVTYIYKQRNFFIFQTKMLQILHKIVKLYTKYTTYQSSSYSHYILSFFFLRVPFLKFRSIYKSALQKKNQVTQHIIFIIQFLKD